MYQAAPNQTRHWRHYRRFPGSPALNMTVALHLEGTIDILALRDAAARIISRHASLMARPEEIDGQLFWRPADEPSFAREQVRIVECRDADAALSEIRAEASRPFALDTEPPTRVAIVTLGDRQCVLLMNIHHSALDGWSVDLIVKEIAVLYAARGKTSAPVLPAAPSYEHYARYQRDYVHSHAGSVDAAYWQERLRGARPGVGMVPDVGPHRARPWPPGRMAWAYLPNGLSADVRAAAHIAGVTPFIVMIGVFARLLGRLAGEPDVVIGVPYLNRLRAQDANLVGFVVNTLPFRLENLEIDARDFTEQVAATARRAFLHQRLPYIHLLRQLGPDFESSAIPLFRTMFILQSNQAARVRFDDLRCQQAWVSTGGAKYDQTWTIEERRGTYTLDVEWNPDLYSKACVCALMEQYAELLQCFVAELGGRANAAACAGSGAAAVLEWPTFERFADFFAGPVVIEAGDDPFSSSAPRGLRSD